MNNQPTTEDRIWAALSHLSALAFGMGILLPIIGWSEQRRKSNYASFQCLQALGYQSLGYTVWILLTLLIMIVLIFVMIPVISMADANGWNVDSIIAQWMIILFAVMMGFIGLYVIFPIIAAVSCAMGGDYRYPIMGNRLARYLEYDLTREAWLNEDHEDRWVAAMGHFSILIILWGMLAPLTAWIVQGNRNLFIKLQSIQTLVYQAGVTLLYLASLFVYFFGFFLLVVTMGVTGEPGMFGFIIFIVASLIAIVIVLLIPLLHILGQWAGYRVLKGDDYRYPLIGRLVDKWISKTSFTAASPPPRTAA